MGNFFRSSLMAVFLILPMSLAGHMVFAEDDGPLAAGKPEPQVSNTAPAEQGSERTEPALPRVKPSEAEDDIVLLKPGHRILIRIYPEDSYIKGSEMEVNSDGNITLPLIGKVHVAGLKLVDAEKMIAKIIDADYLVHPEVSIELKRQKEDQPVNNTTFLVLGQVKKPGTYPIPLEVKKFTLLQAISIGGGFTEVANMKRVKIVRKTDKQRETIQVNVEDIFNGNAPDLEIQNGDVVHVPESMF